MRTMVRTFLGAIHEDLAYQIERDGGLKRNKSYESVVSAASRLEKVNTKYHRVSSGSSVVSGTVPSSSSSDSGTIDELIREFRQLKVNLLNVSDNRAAAKGVSSDNGVKSVSFNTSAPVRQFVCYGCGQVGHKKWESPERNAGSSTAATMGSGVATGSNAIPLGSSAATVKEEAGKGLEHRL